MRMRDESYLHGILDAAGQQPRACLRSRDIKPSKRMIVFLIVALGLTNALKRKDELTHGL
jgi:hypothetical protein